MSKFKKFGLGVLGNREGQALTEYAILMVLVVLGSVAVVRGIGNNLHSKLKKVKSEIASEIVIKRSSGGSGDYRDGSDDE